MQCRDENGFKCHTSSESHLRQMRIFAENSGSFLDQFSSEFEKGFMRILSHRHGTKRVPANIVYQEYIADKQHTHMNATTWTTLTGFCMYLGKTGKAIVDETEKGWFIQFVDRDPKMLARQEAAANRQKAEIDEEERRNRVIQAQIEEAEKRIAESGGQSDQDKDNSLQRLKEDDKVALSLGPSIVQKKKPAAVLKAAFSTEDEDDELGYNESTALPQKHVKSLDFLIREDQSRKRGNNEGEYPPAKRQLSSTDNNWLVRGIIVKVVSKVLEKGKYYKAKGKILRPLDDVTAEMMIEDTKIVVHKSDVETVIPKVLVS